MATNEFQNPALNEGYDDRNIFLTLYDDFKVAYRNGSLAAKLMLAVFIYNFIFFELEEGRELYILVPGVFAIYAYVSKYWDPELTTRIRKFSAIPLLIFAIVVDTIVSITYAPTGAGTYFIASIPTLVADIMALVALILWLLNKTGALEEEAKINDP